MEGICNKVFPDIVDNTYHGHHIVPTIFILLSTLSTVRSLIHSFKDDGGAQSIASIPLHKYPKPAVKTIVVIFAYWGQCQLLLSLVYWVVLWKYRSLLPFAILLFTLEWSMRGLYQLIFVTGKPHITERQAPGGIGNIIFPFVGCILFYLSL